MIAYIRNFSTSFILAMAIWPFLSALLTLPILAMMYHRYHRLRSTAVLTAYLCVLYALGLVTFTLYPMPDDPAKYCLTHAHHPQLNVMQFASDLATGGKAAALQLLLNVVFFIPLGFALTRWARWKFYAVVPAGFLVSLFIETSQLTGVWGIYPCAYRQFDVDDLLTNTLGAIIGCFIAWIYGALVPVREIEDKREVIEKPGLLHRAVALMIDLVFIAIVDISLTLGSIYLFQKSSRYLSNGTYLFLGHAFGTGVSDGLAQFFTLFSFVVFEVLIPVTHRGQTLGGRFTHMSCETKERHGLARALFYVVRLLVLVLATMLFAAPTRQLGVIVLIALVVFWLVAHQMPYDLIPGRDWDSGYYHDGDDYRDDGRNKVGGDDRRDSNGYGGNVAGGYDNDAGGYYSNNPPAFQP
ncbi:VanZ family protein [Bifidobacterium sp. ESL0775]|uniref:VanZ family protein n=1 Tax=Bifidobacterium sp. ESL0775 TaxID=2983230 RepID=UPI0023F859B2|nr:VanZ family protein [Bifidobacterium sp. ESL0775]WEV69408.1 VanZ family protein [Bifidobacterium sp. ESL0775]